MRFTGRFSAFGFIVLLISFAPSTLAAQSYKLPPLPPPEEYGNILLNRISEKNGARPVAFSHWVHRTKYTCRVCHMEAGFNLKSNTTEVTEKANKEGRFCGVCHNGKTAFGHTKGNCNKCHSGDISYGKERFNELASLPRTEYGNKINWVDAQIRGLIKPRNTILGNYKPMKFDKKLEFAAEMSNISPAIFPHDVHALWLDCANCHPDIFNIRKKTTKHFTMARNMNAEFCGTCHLKTAFPLNDCRRCHPATEA